MNPKLLNLPNMKHVIISLNIQDENGRYIPLEALDVMQLKNVDFVCWLKPGKSNKKYSTEPAKYLMIKWTESLLL